LSRPNRHDDVVGRFAEACQSGDIAAVRAILDADVIAVCDGGGAVPAPGLTHGAEDVARLMSVLLGGQPDTELTLESVNGSRGLALRRAGQAIAVSGITVAGGRVVAAWVVLNPAKLNSWHRH
jgi:cobalamin biosynthesis protein CbiG